MLDNSNSGAFESNSSSSPAIWQSGWIDELWKQLSDGSFSGVGNVVLEDGIVQSEQQVLADLEAIDRMLLGSKDIEEMLSEVQQFATENRFNPGIDSLTGSPLSERMSIAAQQLAQVVGVVQA